jgi:hypothetical protein
MLDGEKTQNNAGQTAAYIGPLRLSVRAFPHDEGHVVASGIVWQRCARHNLRMKKKNAKKKKK